MKSRIFTGLNLIAAPILYLAGQILLSRWQAATPDAIWFTSHGLLLAGAALLIPGIFGMRTVSNRPYPVFARWGEAVSVFGALGLIGQFSIDLAVGLIATDQPEMVSAFRAIQSSPVMNLIFYRLPPICLFTGQLALLVSLSLALSIPGWIGAAAGLGYLLIETGVFTNNFAFFIAGFAFLELGIVLAGARMLTGTLSKAVPSSQGAMNGD